MINDKEQIELLEQEKEAILEADEKFLKAWNNGDARQAASFFTEDSVRIDPFGNIQHGRDQIEKAFEQLMKALPGAKIKYSDKEIRMLAEDCAIFRHSIELSSPALKSRKNGYTVTILKKENNEWKILEVHPKIFQSMEKFKNE